MALVVTWQRDENRAHLRDADDGLWATLRLVDDWHEPASQQPVRAWVVEWLDKSGSEPRMEKARLHVSKGLALDSESMGRLGELAAEVARSSAPSEPEAFGYVETGLVRDKDIHKRIELLSHAIQQAQSRLNEAARITDPWGAEGVLIALTEILGWVRALDDAMKHVWKGLPDDRLVDITAQIDKALDRPVWDPKFVSWARDQRQDAGYSDWTLGLILRNTGLPRDELRAMRWLAGKLLHFGPLSAAELKQWRAGEPPRWKWRASKEIFPKSRGERQSHERQAYDRNLAGRDLLGTFNLFSAAMEAEFLAWELVGRPDY